jgi:cytochrome c oxidase subunit 2
MLGVLHWLGLPVAASAHGAEVDHIMVLVHWLMVVLFVGWGTFFVYVLFRFRSRRNPRASYAGARGRFASVVETGVLVAEIVLLAFFSIPFWRANVDARPPDAATTEVRVVAEQFSWNFHYPGADGRFGRTSITLVDPDNPLGLDRSDPAAKDDITTINELHLPVGRTVVIHLSSKDVVHSLGIPEMRVKQDAIPGIVQPVWFTPTRTGRGEIACSQLCGLAHYRMRAFYTVDTPEQYDAWLQEEAAALQPQ